MGKKKEDVSIDLSKLNLARVGHNFLYKTRNGEHSVSDTNLVADFLQYALNPEQQKLPKYKVGVMMVCVNAPYWQYFKPVVDGIKQYFLPGHDVEIMMWSDVPETKDAEKYAANYPETSDSPRIPTRSYVYNTIHQIRKEDGITFFPVESLEWPYPTLFRYHFFMGQEEYLKKFDYLFYIDLDMRIVNIVGDEIFGDGLTAAQHPMYALRHEYNPPYEPNPDSKAYIPRPGRILVNNGKPQLQPLYFAGGVQGGTTSSFIEAMRTMRDNTNADLDNNYIAVWNDESHWNKYCFDHPPAVVLSPAYVYPDSLINEYYVKIWGRNYNPRIITLTKPFTLSKEGGQAAQNMAQTS